MDTALFHITSERYILSWISRFQLFGAFAFLNSRGVQPINSLKHRLNVRIEENPHIYAIFKTGASITCKKDCAYCSLILVIRSGKEVSKFESSSVCIVSGERNSACDIDSTSKDSA